MQPSLASAGSGSAPALFALALVVLVGGHRRRAVRASRGCRSQKFGLTVLDDRRLGSRVRASSARGRSSGARSTRPCSRCCIAAPIALGIAIFLSELCPPRLRAPLIALTELLAAIPVDRLRPLGHLRAGARGAVSSQVAFPDALRQLPLFTGPPLGVGMLSAALILAVMVIPFTSSVAREVLQAVPAGAARGRVRARRHAVGGDPRRACSTGASASSAPSCSASAARSARRWR